MWPVAQFLHLVPWFLWLLSQGYPLDCLALVTRRLSFPGSHASVTRGDTVWVVLPQGAASTADGKQIPRLSVKKKLLASHGLDFSGRLQFRSGVHLEAVHQRRWWGTQARGHRCCALSLSLFLSLSLSVSLQLTGIPQKGACKFTQSPDFCNCHPGDTSRSSGSESQPGLCM